MGLFRCVDCKRKISDQAVSCPHCGRPVRRKEIVYVSDKLRIGDKILNLPKSEYALVKIIGWLMVIIVSFLLVDSIITGGNDLFKIFTDNEKDKYSEKIKNESEVVRQRDAYELISDSINYQFNNYIYGGGELSYYSHSITSYGRKNETTYEPSGNIYYSKLYSDKKWKGTFSCRCSVDIERQTGGCSCTRSGTATIIW